MNPLYHLLAIAPNDEMTSPTWVSSSVVHLALTGNSYSEIQRAGDGSAIGLWPLNPRLTKAVRLPNGDLAYQTTDGQDAGAPRIIDSKDVLHCLLSSWDGLVGMSPIHHARETLRMAIASERFGNNFFRNCATPQMAITMPPGAKIKPEDKSLCVRIGKQCTPV